VGVKKNIAQRHLHMNGTTMAPAPAAQREADFLQHLLRIRDEVLAGKYPRIRLPPKVLEQVAPRQLPSAPSAKPTTNGIPNGSSHSLPPVPKSSLQYAPSPHEFASPAAPGGRPFANKSVSSGIDPVLLTKSDNLIRAELQLKRQQLERTLKDQVDKRARATDDEREGLYTKDLLSEAQKLVKPVSGLRTAPADSDGNDSFDENSYYSSKAGSWSSDEHPDRTHATDADAAEPLTAQGKGKRPIADAQPAARTQNPQASHTVIDLEEDYEPVDDIDIYEPEPARLHEEADESDYSPPPADIGSGEHRRGRQRDNGNLNG
jgi:hypothetical protein